MHFFQFADKVCKLRQAERNEVIFREIWGPRKCTAFPGL